MHGTQPHGPTEVPDTWKSRTPGSHGHTEVSDTWIHGRNGYTEGPG
jgi:hypothetical protein